MFKKRSFTRAGLCAGALLLGACTSMGSMGSSMTLSDERLEAKVAAEYNADPSEVIISNRRVVDGKTYFDASVRGRSLYCSVALGGVLYAGITTDPECRDQD
ncbi:MAG TPA: hypothetical protein VNU47_01890 [Candidatus Paceibacterota bacterium]|nr:hypothetical protein [Candidatus Paceibacterota bacterium]